MKVRIHYPRSFLKLILLGFVLAAVPILGGLFYSVFALDQLAKESRRVVYQGAHAANVVRELGQTLVKMERGVRQYAILGDEDLRQGYDQARGRFLELGASLEKLPWQPAQRRLLDSLLTLEADSHSALVRGAFSPGAIRHQTRTFARMGQFAQQLAQDSHLLLDQQVSGLQARVEDTRRRVDWMLWMLVPLGLLLALGLPLFIAKPVRQIDGSIRRLRDGHLTEPVQIDGPSDLKYLAQRLDWLRQGLLDAEADKSRFLRHLSHELKTPLAALRESSELLYDGSLGALKPAQEEVVGILRQNGLRLQRLIEDLLAYRSLSDAPTSPAIRNVQFGEVLDQVLDAQRATLLARALSVDSRGTMLSLLVDPEKLRVILDNLLSNAIKFSPPGYSIRVEAREDDKEVTVEVADKGPGVAVQDRPRIFDSFYQGQAPKASSVGGTGLGLAIAREHVLAHGGRIELVEKEGEGACFRVTLPKRREGR